MAIFLVIK
ncbi:UNVERIFIED_CONTAM: hypothetical protein GTU68_030441 [Idotea baltica]|nr:hypothetical protein [Idotea baltica]